LKKIHPPAVTLHLDNDPREFQCSRYYGRAEAFHEDKFPQYAKIFISCEEELSNRSIYRTVLHEFAHTIGLGYTHNKVGDLLCSVELLKRICSILPNNQAEPSTLDISTVLHIYGNDGFGGINKIEVNKPYYIEKQFK
jgi:hypothetical protein